MAKNKVPKQKIKVLVADDDYYVRNSLRILLSKDPRTTVVDIASNPRELLEKLKSFKSNSKVEVLLLDVKFEEEAKSGLDFITAIKKIDPNIKILVTSMVRKEETIMKAIKMGANGFVWKNETGESIANAIAKVFENRFVLTKSIAEKIIGKTMELRNYVVDILPNKKYYQEMTEALRETMYLYCICGMSAKEIAEELSISISTVNSRIKLAYSILHATNRSGAFEHLVSHQDELQT